MRSNNTKSMWRTIRGLLDSNKSGESPPIPPDVLNDYCSTIGPQLNSTFHGEPLLNWTRPESIHRFHFESILEENVLKYLSGLSTESSLDVLGFDTRLLNCGADVLTASLTELF